MRLLIRRGYTLVNEMRFSDGPIYIGRRPQCQVFLPDRTVSRQHAVMFTLANGDWMVQDLESSNCTTVNSQPISKVVVHEGDIVGIADFFIEVRFEPQTAVQATDQPVDLDETVVGSPLDMTSVYQVSCGAERTIHLNAVHLKNFYRLNAALFDKHDQEQLLDELTDILLAQFEASNVWAGLRETTTGPLTCHCGRSQSGAHLTLEGLVGKDIIKQTIQKEIYILLPSFADFFPNEKERTAEIEKIKSAMAAPIVAPAGIYGVIYLNNAFERQPYNHQDLDYLTLISTQMAALIEHIG